MRKILSLILGLLWALPAFAALPSGYTQLEYIQSTGTQYIDTGIYLASNMVVVVKAEQTGTGGNIFGYTQGDSGRWMLSLNATTSTATLYSDKTNVVGSFSSMPVEITCNMGTGITVNGITTNFTESATRTAPATAWLFKAQGSSATPSGRIYYFKIYQNNNLIMNLVPAKNSSDVLGLYDFVSGQFFTNSGTGEFIAGPVVEIKIATTKYNESAFGPLNTALANAISVVDTVVSNTITQAASIATLQAQKQTRPNDIADDNEKCPAGKKCLLVEDASGVPHWYEIVEKYSRLPDGYTELQWIESTGTQYIDTGLNPKPDVTSVEFELAITDTSTEQIFGARQTSSATTGSYNIFANVSPKQFRLDWVGSSGTVVDGIVVGTFYKFVLNADGSVDFQNEHFESAATKVACDYNMYLFGGNSAGTTAFGKVRYKGAVKIKERDTLVRDFVPAKNASGVVGMYDTVSGVFYENKGTGEFIAGDPVSE